MITRRRAFANISNNEEVQNSDVPLDVEVTDFDLGDMAESVASSPSEDLRAEDVDVMGLGVDDLLGIDDLNWTLEGDELSPLFDIGSIEFGVGYSTDQDSGSGAPTTPSPERTPAAHKTKCRDDQAGRNHVNKNAINARINRLKKKEFVNGLESRVESLSSENRTLKQENGQLNKRVEELEDETRYLRAVLANESMLAQLLSRLSGVKGMKLSSSLFQGLDTNDHDYALPEKRVKLEEKETSGGVCLHVDENHVSVEFCTKCAKSASASIKM